MRSRATAVLALLSTLFLFGACTQEDNVPPEDESGLSTEGRALVVSSLGFFELDGNADEDPIPGDDWETLEAGGGDAFKFSRQADPDGASIFTTGGSKDINDVTAWRWTNGSVPDKDDLLNAFAAAYTCPEGTAGCNEGDLLIYFGSDRYANNGDANIAFWFFQDDIALLDNGQFDGEHKQGDLLIVIKYPQGSNALPIVLGYEWVNSGGDASEHLLTKFSSDEAECGSAGEQEVCAITNDADAAAFWPYAPKFGTAGTYPYESLYEGGVNVTALFGFTPCFNTFLAESRSSESVTSQLKDFVLRDFELCGAAIDKDCEATLQPSGDAVDVTFFGYLENTGSAPLEIELTDSDEAIDKVCFDDPEDGSCDGDDVPDDLSISPAGVASFTLGPGDKVLYIGTYTDTSPVVTPGTDLFEYSDTVTAQGWEVGVEHTTAPVLSESASAKCDVPGIPAITISKLCTSKLNAAGNALLVKVWGDGENTGDVKLASVKLSDVPALDTLVVCLNAAPVVGVCPGVTLCNTYASCSTTGFELIVGDRYYYEGTYTVTTDLEPEDTMTVTSKSAYSETPATDSADASCHFEDANPEIEATKECAIVLNTTEVGGKVVLEAVVTGKVKNTGDLELTSVTLSDSVVGPITLSDTTLSPGEEVSYSFSYFPDDVPGTGTSCEADYSDTVTANGIAALGYGAVEPDQATAQCSLCPHEPPYCE